MTQHRGQALQWIPREANAAADHICHEAETALKTQPEADQAELGYADFRAAQRSAEWQESRWELHTDAGWQPSTGTATLGWLVTDAIRNRILLLGGLAYRSAVALSSSFLEATALLEGLVALQTLWHAAAPPHRSHRTHQVTAGRDPTARSEVARAHAWPEALRDIDASLPQARLHLHSHRYKTAHQGCWQRVTEMGRTGRRWALGLVLGPEQ